MNIPNWLKNRLPIPTLEDCSKREVVLMKELSGDSYTSSVKLAQLEACSFVKNEIANEQFDWFEYVLWLFASMPNKFAACCFCGILGTPVFSLLFLLLTAVMKLLAITLPWLAMATYFIFCVSSVLLVVCVLVTFLFLYFRKKG